MPDTPILELKNIHFNYRNRRILSGINFTLFPGEIHAIAGEHRAGKTPLIKLINGELKPKTGRILIRGEEVRDMTIRKSLELGIGVVHQEAQIMPNLNSLENIIAGRIPRGRIKRQYLKEQFILCRNILNDLDCHIDLTVPLSQLGQTERQMVEIARIIALDGDILIFDDVGSRLTPAEMNRVLDYIKQAKDRGKAIIFIDSDVDKVLEISDRVTVLQNGYSKGTEEVASMDRLKLLKLTYNFALNYREGQESEEPLQLRDFSEKIFSNLPAGILVLDDQHNLVSTNQGARKILGLDRNSLKGLTIDELLSRTQIKQRSDIIQAIELHRQFTWSNLVLNKTHIIRIKTMPNFDNTGAFTSTIILLEDITMDNSVSEYLQRAEKISMVAEMAAGVSHEINNPLGIINNYVQLLKLKESDPDTSEKVDKIDLQLKRIKDISSSLLSFSRQPQSNQREFDLVMLMNEVILLLDYKIREKKINLEKRGFPASLMIRGDDSSLRQVLVNLINNSIEAVENKGRIRVSILEDPHKQQIEIHIYDNGYGIPLDIRDDIFMPFFSTKVTRQNAGLGLSICQQIIENHRGILTFESQEGEYTEFRIQLPLLNK